MANELEIQKEKIIPIQTADQLAVNVKMKCPNCKFEYQENKGDFNSYVPPAVKLFCGRCGEVLPLREYRVVVHLRYGN